MCGTPEYVYHLLTVCVRTEPIRVRLVFKLVSVYSSLGGFNSLSEPASGTAKIMCTSLVRYFFKIRVHVQFWNCAS